MSDRLLVFLRAPRVGQVKTRLARDVGAPRALTLYRDLVERVLGSLAAIRNVQLCFTPDDAAPEVSPWLRPGWTAAPQGDGDLGLRLIHALGRAFDEGAQRVVVIGTDAPEIGSSDIADAFAVLEATDGVIGPAPDGGYWLIGLNRSVPAIFTDIPWGGPGVLAATEAAGVAAGLRIRRLRWLADIDTGADLEAWHQRTDPRPRA